MVPRIHIENSDDSELVVMALAQYAEECAVNARACSNEALLGLIRASELISEILKARTEQTITRNTPTDADIQSALETFNSEGQNND